MKRERVVIGLFGLGALLCAMSFLGAQVARTFQPPRTAVVDISQVFEGYDKKRDRQEQFQAEIKAAEDKLKDLEKEYKDLISEIGNLEEGERKKEKELEKFKLERDVKDLKQTEMKRLRDTQMKYLQEIRDEIADEIKTYAQAQDLDLVIEKTVMAETGNDGGFRWPIVHYAKPEIDISTEIAERLNVRYRPRRDATVPLPAGAAPAPAPSPGNAVPPGGPRAPGQKKP